MRLLACLLLLNLVASAMGADTISVMCFNLRGDFDGGVATDKPDGWLQKSGAHRRDLALNVVRDADPDLLGVQEAYRNQIEELDAALPGHAFYGVGREDGAEEGEHSAIYYRRERFEPLDSGTLWLSNTPDKPSLYPGAACRRIASWVVLRDKAQAASRDGGSPLGELLVLNTHWDHVSDEARRHSGAMIAERLPELAEGRAAIVMGDLNATEETPALAALRDGPVPLVDSYRAAHPQRNDDERTFHGFRGGDQGSRIDFILHSDRLKTTGAEILRTDDDGVYPSDHYPVTAELAPR
ncbi:endonuclease/exonuclease/phosphatase family protein [Botrimarina sp.]|uniref:endonuclease/exonuclease/phosphatase family protein n=1 Tax=Botrimarina sp. TaxID=2795802 RepID=UPI0032EB76E1